MAKGDTNRTRSIAVAAFVLLSAHAQTARAAPRTPGGVYLHFEIRAALDAAGLGKADETTQAAYISKRLNDELNSPALAGIAVGAHWNDLQPKSRDKYKWAVLDSIFDVADSLKETVQLIIIPGFDTPQWVKDNLSPCDKLLNNSSAAADCGSAKFVNFPEQSHVKPDQNGNYVLPMPWSGKYQSDWWNFLTTVNNRYQARTSFVAIAVAGPVGGSDEMILPTTSNKSKPKDGKLDTDSAWTAFITNYNKDSLHPAYPTASDQIFVDAWNTTFNEYQSIFSGLTIFIGPDAGNDLPIFAKTVPDTIHHQRLYNADCKDAGGFAFSCEAKTQIISDFLASSNPHQNQLATQVGGMTAHSAPELGNIGVAGVKLLTAPYKSLWTTQQAIGGAEFDHPVSDPAQHMGCPESDPECKLPLNANMSAERAAANVLKVFFHNTRVGQDYGDPKNGNETMNYLDIPEADVIYMEQHKCCSLEDGQTSLLQQIYATNNYLLNMAGKPRRIANNLCGPNLCGPPIKCTTPRSCCVANGGQWNGKQCE